MAYNKSKHIEAAQKHLHQGKIAQAVGEYQVILKHEPKDQVTLMTIGDLFVRQGETFQALEYFERLAQVFLNDGFLTKAIAIYKKTAKLAPEETRPLERLADLYVQQGVLSEARPIYLQLAETHQRASRSAQAAALLHKLLEAEPDNLRVQTRLAELALAMGQRVEAVAAFRAAAVQLQQRGDHAEAIKYAERALQIDASDAPTLALRARAVAATGRRDDAVALLAALPNLDAGGETADLLLDLYLEAGEVQGACELAAKILAREAKQHAPARRVAAAVLEGNEPDRALALIDLVRSAMIASGEHEQLSHLLTSAAERLPGRIEPREWLVDLYGHASDSFRLADALADLAEAYEAAGQHDRARQTYGQLVEREPENEVARRKYAGAQARLGVAENTTAVHEAPRAPLGEAELPAAPQPSEPTLDDESALFVSQALTDVDLFSSYGLTQKAMELLETVLQRMPRHPVILERLLDLCLGLGDDRRTAELSSQLEQIHREQGNTPAADRFAELRRRFERAAALAPQESAAPAPAAPLEFAIPMVEAEPEPSPAASTDAAATAEELLTESAVHEVDLSEEWAALAGQLNDDVPSASAETAELLSDRDAPNTVPGAPAPASEPETEMWPEPAEVLAGLSAEAPHEYELALETSPPNGGFAAPAENTDSFLQALSAELDEMLPALVGAEPERPQAASAAPASGSANLREPVLGKAALVEPRGPLGDVFDEFRAELGEASADDEDLETHYNLGVAYREMGLIEEAISEFQKVAKANDQGRPFRYAMQCCTLLGLAFMERGQPSISAMWYERALQTPGLDPENILALQYDLGVAQELAGDRQGARKSFSQVYGMNIDYRDVAERLAALGKAG
jgi:tetratricopeptide (TPR) repeat protein